MEKRMLWCGGWTVKNAYAVWKGCGRASCQYEVQVAKVRRTVHCRTELSDATRTLVRDQQHSRPKADEETDLEEQPDPTVRAYQGRYYEGWKHPSHYQEPSSDEQKSE